MTTGAGRDQQLDIYVARRVCGCYTGSIPDDPAKAEQVTRAISEWIAAGREVTRVPAEYARLISLGCKHTARQMERFREHEVRGRNAA